MSEAIDMQILNQPASTTNYDAVVVGAGPYGLSTAAHLSGEGIKVAVLGKPLQTWRENMPSGMLLRSYWWATNFSDPGGQYGLTQYFQEKGQQAADPLPVETVIDYGLWFQKHAVPYLDETYVQTIKRDQERFEITLADGRVLQSRVVVMAPGLQYYTYRPPEYDHLQADLVSHSSDYRTFERLAGKSVVIIGGGQGALETAALAYERGVDVQVVSRHPIVWLAETVAFPEHRPLLERLRRPKASISPSKFNWAEENFPYTFQRLPRSLKDRILGGIGRHGPAGSGWLKPRLIGKVPLYEGVSVPRTWEVNNGLCFELSNGMTLKADHVILATGYRADVKRLSMLDPSLIQSIETYRNAPILRNQFESSVPGLYFVGFSSTSSCGPLYRFVAGTAAAARRVAGSVAQQVPVAGRK